MKIPMSIVRKIPFAMAAFTCLLIWFAFEHVQIVYARGVGWVVWTQKPYLGRVIMFPAGEMHAMIRMKVNGKERRAYASYERPGMVDYSWVDSVGNVWNRDQVISFLRQANRPGQIVSGSVCIVEKVGALQEEYDGIFRPVRI